MYVRMYVDVLMMMYGRHDTDYVTDYDTAHDSINVLMLYWNIFILFFIVIMFGYVILMLYLCIMIKGCITGIMYYVVSPRNIQKTR